MEYYTVKEISQLLNCGENEIRNLILNEVFPSAFKENNKVWMISKKDFEQYEECQKKLNEDYYTVKETSLLLNVSEPTVLNWIKQGGISGAIFLKKLKAHKKTWFLPKTTIKGLSFDAGDFYNVQEVIKTLGHTKKTILNWIKIGYLQNCVLHNNLWWIPKSQINRIKRIENYLTVDQAMNLLDCSQQTVLKLIQKNDFPDAVFHGNVWRIPKRNISIYQDSLEIPSGYLLTAEVANKLGLSITSIILKASKGEIKGAIKKEGIWIYPEQAVDEYILKKNAPPLNDPILIFQNGLNDLDIADNLTKTIYLFNEFVVTKLSASRAAIENKQSLARMYLSTLNRVLSILKKEVFLLNDLEVIQIIKNDLLNPTYKGLFTQFLDYCQNSITCAYNNKYREVRKKSNERDIYSPDEFFSYYTYVQEYQKHIDEALINRRYAVTWLYVMVHMIDAWRKSDVLKLPNVPIEVIGIECFEDFTLSRFTKENSQYLVNQISSRIERMYVAKTGAMGHFLVNSDMVIPVSIALTVCELHRRNENDSLLLRFWTKDAKSNDPHKKTHFAPFFKDRPELTNFSSMKMNRSLLTYFFYSVTEGNSDASLSYDLSIRLRAHLGQDTTSLYIQSINKDGPLDKVSVNLFNRGHFGWLYNFILNLTISEEQSRYLTMEQRTNFIKELSKEYTPIQLEELAYFIKQNQNEKQSLAVQIANMPLEKLQENIIKIFRGEMPARIKNAQCFTYPNCAFPTATTCLHCKYVIPKTFLMISIVEEINNRITSIKEAKYDAVRVRESIFIYKMLDLLMQAQKEFGKEYISQFIDLKKLENQLIVIERLLK